MDDIVDIALMVSVVSLTVVLLLTFVCEKPSKQFAENGEFYKQWFAECREHKPNFECQTMWEVMKK